MAASPSQPTRPRPPAAPGDVLQANLSRKLTRGKENGTSMSAATGSKDSLYTVQDPALASLPAAPTHRVAAPQQQQQVAAYDRYGQDTYSSRNQPAMAWC